jgi:hypothetical protein
LTTYRRREMPPSTQNQSKKQPTSKRGTPEKNAAPGAPTEQHPLDVEDGPADSPGAPTERHPADFAGK